MSCSDNTDCRLAVALDRISQLERGHRRWRRGLTASVAALLAIVTMQSAPQPFAQSNVLSAQRIDITDPTGRQRAVLGFVEGVGPGLVLYGERGEAQLMVAAQESGPSIYMYDRNGTMRARLEVHDMIGPALVLNDPSGRTRSTLAVIQESPRLSMLNADGQAFWKTP